MKPQTSVQGAGEPPNNLCHPPYWQRAAVSMSFASEIFHGHGLYYRGELAGILIYRSFYGLINGIHLGKGRRPETPLSATRLALYFILIDALGRAIISARSTPLKVLIENLCAVL